MPFDTDKSYAMFIGYYLSQQAPRNVSQAYRDATPRPKDEKGADTRPAPTNWAYWAQGRTTRGERKQCVFVKDDGTEELIDVPTWEERAGAYDTHMFRREMKRREQMLDGLRNQAEQTLSIGMEKLKAAWEKYTPDENSIQALSQATRLLNEQFRIVFPETDEEDPAALLPDGVGAEELERLIERSAQMVARELDPDDLDDLE